MTSCITARTSIGPGDRDHTDNALRFGVLSRVVLEYAIGLKNPPSLVHAHNWQTGLVPALLRTCYLFCSVLSQMPSVFTIQNLAYQGLFPLDTMDVLGLDPSLFAIDGLEF